MIQVLPALEVGGVERGTLEVAEALQKAGHQSLVISAGGRMVKALENTGSRHIQIAVGKKSLLTFRHIRSLRKLFIDENPDIVHARSRLPAWISWLALRGLANRPAFVTTVHGPYTVNKYSAIMCRGDRVIAISDFIRDYIVNNYPETDTDRIRIIPRGVDATEFPFGYTAPADWLNDWRSQNQHLVGRFILTLPARITRWKGQEDFIHVIAGLIKTGIPAHGLIAGGAEPRRAAFLQELKSLAASYGIEQYVSFLGQRNDMKNIMSISNVVLSLAREPEAFGRTALEALAIGKPVIAYNHGGAAEVLGTIFPDGAVEPLNIKQTIEKATRFHQQLPAVQQTNPFTRQAMLEKTMAVYRECISHRR